MWKSGYLVSVFELRPVSRCQESLFRSCWTSSDKLNRRSGLAKWGNLVKSLVLALSLRAVLRAIIFSSTQSGAFSVDPSTMHERGMAGL